MDSPGDAAGVDAVITAIEEAFAAVPRGAITLHEAEVIDDYGTTEERRRARKWDPEESWQNVPNVSIEACLDALPHLDPISWRFYLPAFMRHGLRRLRSPHGAVDRAIYALALGDDAEINAYLRERFRTLDTEQARAVRRFLEFAAESDAYCDARVARQALQKYWGRV
jgi:hypothetical protein